MVRAKKHLGQHFLTDKNIARKIADSIPVDKRYNIAEVGPGTGVLTEQLLLSQPLNYYGFEVDEESVEYLAAHFPKLKGRIRQEDFLNTRLADYFEEDIAVIGNFPYNISSQILFHVIHNRDIIAVMIGMFQKEVAERITSAPGNKRYGILSVLTQAFFDCEYLFTVHENVFKPNPQVKSAVIRLTRNPARDPKCDHSLFFKVVKTGFNQRRKTLKNSLKSLFKAPVSEHELLNKRPEQLGVDEFTQITNLIKTQ
ncbi:MAG: 16S rRNA (adenine(1518)-N(6)/adenine(1519)-N(6))-dimethyltransferase RsmA [Bacteroidales bacterium]|nr:16S rRNA (adenine(1518)-N(6)/adenine(1519)-N(6))-dimethyltransferase RsmA [Bacteroidales bacterium]MCF8334286.1 16S rRNA (adenine(1518)-N(6)/adenine(1519)-N(6))-dimethyltransferase RsmA [Bacteroidales bacterium]